MGEKANKTYHRALELEEQRIFVEELKGDFYYEFIAFMLLTGMRYGEVACLLQSDVDYAKNVIHITKTVTTDENGKTIVGPPKSDSGERDIPITESMKSVLHTQKEKMCIIKGTLDLEMEDKVFSTPYYNMPSDEVINNAISEVLQRLEQKKKGVAFFTSHALRDTFATRFLETHPEDYKTLQVLLGHSSIKITMDLYAHVLDNTMQSRMKKLNIEV